MKPKGWHLYPTARQLLTLEELAKELGRPVPTPATREEARALQHSYRMEKERNRT